MAGDTISAPSHPSLAQEELYKDYQHQASSLGCVRHCWLRLSDIYRLFCELFIGYSSVMSRLILVIECNKTLRLLSGLNLIETLYRENDRDLICLIRCHGIRKVWCWTFTQHTSFYLTSYVTDMNYITHWRFFIYLYETINWYLTRILTFLSEQRAPFSIHPVWLAI